MGNTPSTTRLSGADAAKAIAEGALLIDVRSEIGRGRNGELQGAVIVAKSDVLELLSKRVSRASSDQKIVVFCGSIDGSGPVIDALTQAGFQNVYDVEGGFGALQQQGLSTIPRPKPAA